MAPTITGNKLRQIDLHFSDHRRSNKDYRVTVTADATGMCRVWYEHGPAGRLQQGGEKTKTPVDEAKAMALAEQLRDAKVHGRDSYTVTGDRRFSRAPAPAPEPPRAKPETKRPAITSASLGEASRAFLDSLI